MAWRFYTVPGRPGETDGAASDKAIAEIAAPTWNGEYWTIGGGGTVWDSIVYDQELDLLYFGVGNGSPWSQAYRGKIGDNLFLVSIVAVKPDTGEYVWHYQEVPGDEWDFTSVQPMMLADLQINGETRKVLMHAPKNGFFYVIDRTNGQLISAEPFAPVTWATVDRQGDGPADRESRRALFSHGQALARHARSARRAQLEPDGVQPQHRLRLHSGERAHVDLCPGRDVRTARRWASTPVPTAARMPRTVSRPCKRRWMPRAAHLLAWDPVNQKEAWRVEHPGPGNGGILATAGNLVFQGTFGGDFVVYRADTGEKLWSMPVQTSVIAGPMSYEIDGEQYIAVLVGTGGAIGLTQGAPSLKSGPVRNVSRMLAFKLGGTATLTEPAPVARAIDPPPLTATAAVVAEGSRLYRGQLQRVPRRGRDLGRHRARSALVALPLR